MAGLAWAPEWDAGKGVPPAEASSFLGGALDVSQDLRWPSVGTPEAEAFPDGLLTGRLGFLGARGLAPS